MGSLEIDFIYFYYSYYFLFNLSVAVLNKNHKNIEVLNFCKGMPWD